MPSIKREVLIIFLSFVSLVFGGTIIFRTLEGLSWVDAYYFTIVTMSTVGYGDISPETPEGKIFATIYIFFGVGLFAFVVNAVAKYRMDRKLKKYSSSEDSQPE